MVYSHKILFHITACLYSQPPGEWSGFVALPHMSNYTDSNSLAPVRCGSNFKSVILEHMLRDQVQQQFL